MFVGAKLLSSSIRRHTISKRDWSSDVCSSDLTSAPVTFTTNVPPPAISSLSPSSATAGGGGFTLTVYGLNFTSGARSEERRVGIERTFVSATQVTASVLASLIASAGTANITVT